MSSSKQENIQTISIKAPARLHLGFLDMHGGLGRKFGSIGLCISGITTHLVAKKSADISTHGKCKNRVAKYASTILQALQIESGVEITIHEAIPRHIGLGSGTQLALAIGVAIARLYGLQHATQKIAELMQRGNRSGIGIGAFNSGGFLIDGGRGKNTIVPPIIKHYDFPEAWRILLIFDNEVQGLSGSPEKNIFDTAPKMDANISAQICRHVLMQILPGLMEEDCQQFGTGISAIQKMIGRHFSDIQGGYYRSAQVADCIEWTLTCGATGVGQSSWGPTGFAIYPDQDSAQHAVSTARKKWAANKNLSFNLYTAHNTMAEITMNE